MVSAGTGRGVEKCKLAQLSNKGVMKISNLDAEKRGAPL